MHACGLEPNSGVTLHGREGPLPVGDGSVSGEVRQTPSIEPMGLPTPKRYILGEGWSEATAGVSDSDAAERWREGQNAQARLLLGVKAVHHLADERVDAEVLDEQQVHLLAAGEELGDDVEVGVALAAGVDHGDADLEGRRVAVVEAEAVKHAGEQLAVARHVLPQERVVLGRLAVPELDAVAPDAAGGERRQSVSVSRGRRGTGRRGAPTHMTSRRR